LKTPLLSLGKGEKVLLTFRTSLRLPVTVTSYQEFEEAVLTVRLLHTGVRTDVGRERFVDLMYYTLGWLLGDLGKKFGPKELMTASLNLSLSKRHPENEDLGNFVFFQCLRELGIQTKRVRDRGPDRSSPYGAYYWDSARSPLFGWFHTACLGLKWNERTSFTPVKMDWILAAPTESRLWFLRGLADSDGDVHFKDKSVGITTSPNTDFVNSLIRSLGCRTHLEVYPNFSKVVLPAPQAANIGVFNPEVLTYRRKTLEKLVGARTFERHWPQWLEAKVTGFLDSGLDVRAIRDRILEEDNVFTRLHTLNRKRISHRRNSTVPGAGLPSDDFGPAISREL